MKMLFTSVIMAVLLMVGQSAWSAIPRTIAYQGYLNSDTYTGSAQMTFNLYVDATGGTPLWTESQNGVSVVKGGYTVLLGKGTVLDLNFDKVYYLGVTVGTDAEILPRYELSASPFAFRAINADSADTLSLSCNDGQMLGYSDSSKTWGCVDGSAAGAGSWGAITGTLSKQSDLVAALDGKVNTTTTVNGRELSGNVKLIAADLGLGSVNNTADLNKPVSFAMQTALSGKAASGLNSDITRLSGLKTALTVAQGGTGSTTLIGYVKGTGTNALTAATSIPVTEISGLGTFATKSQASLTADVTGVLPVTKGGTGSTTRNFVDFITNEAITGAKTFSKPIVGSLNGNATTATTAESAGSLNKASTLPNYTLATTQLSGDISLNVATTAFASAAATNAALSKAAKGANSDITSLSGLSTPLSVAQGGTGITTLNGYVKGSGSTALTALDKIPATDLSGLGSLATKSQANLTSDVTGVLQVSMGGTGSATRNFVSTTESEDISGTKNFKSPIIGSLSGNATTASSLSAASTLPKDTLAVTLDAMDNSDKIATTKFVHSMADSVSFGAAKGDNSDINTMSSLTTVTTAEATDFTLTTGGNTDVKPQAGSIKLTGGAAKDNDQDTAVGGLIALVGGDFIGTNEVGLAGSVSISGGFGGKGTGGDVLLSAGKGGFKSGAVKVQGLRILFQDTTSTNTSVQSTAKLSRNVLAINDDLTPATSNYGVNLTVPANTLQYTLTLPSTAGISKQVLSTDGSGVLSWVTPASGTITGITAAPPMKSSVSLADSTILNISIPQATSEVSGYLSSTDFGVFSGKQNASTILDSIGALKVGSGWLYKDDLANFSYKLLTAADVGLGTIPSTPPDAGQILIGNVNKAYAAQIVSGDGTLDGTGKLTVNSFTGTLPVKSGGTGVTGFNPGGLVYASSGTSSSLASLNAATSGGQLLVSSDNAPPIWSANPTLSGDLEVKGNVKIASGKTLTLSNNNKAVSISVPNTMSGDYKLSLPAAAPTTNGQVLTGDTSGNLSWSSIVGPPAGGIMAFGGSGDPAGWFQCDGRQVSRITEANLFAAIGTNYGSGDGTTTFNLPDMRGRVPRGVTSTINSITGSSVSGNIITTSVDHNLNRTGVKIRLTTGTANGLNTVTTYYAIVIGPRTFKVANTLQNALAGLAMTISTIATPVFTEWEDPDAGSRTASTVGGNTANNVGSMQNDAFAAHSHTVSGTLYRQTESGDVSVHPVSGSFQRDNTESTLAGTAPETRMANVGVNYIIKR